MGNEWFRQFSCVQRIIQAIEVDDSRVCVTLLDTGDIQILQSSYVTDPLRNIKAFLTISIRFMIRTVMEHMVRVFFSKLLLMPLYWSRGLLMTTEKYLPLIII